MKRNDDKKTRHISFTPTLALSIRHLAKKEQKKKIFGETKRKLVLLYTHRHLLGIASDMPWC